MQENKFELPTEILLRAIIAVNLKELRKKHGLTQTQLSQMTGIDRVSIAKYETCKSLMNMEKLLRITKSLGETPNNLLKGWEEIYKND